MKFQETIGRLKFAAFDEKLSVIKPKIIQTFAQSYRQDAYVTELFGWLKQLKTGKTLSQVVKEIHEDFNEKKEQKKLGKAQEHMLLDVIKTLEGYEQISNRTLKKLMQNLNVSAKNSRKNQKG